VVKQMRVDPDHTQVAMIKYAGSKHAEIVFHFKKHDNSDDTVAEISSTPYLGGWTDTGLKIYEDRNNKYTPFQQTRSIWPHWKCHQRTRR
jgi:hypothetical protein